VPYEKASEIEGFSDSLDGRPNAAEGQDCPATGRRPILARMLAILMRGRLVGHTSTSAAVSRDLIDPPGPNGAPGFLGRTHPDQRAYLNLATHSRLRSH
jgi:hypothetical protein